MLTHTKTMILVRRFSTQPPRSRAVQGLKVVGLVTMGMMIGGYVCLGFLNPFKYR